MKEGDVVLCTYGIKPFQHLYEFGYYTDYGCVVYIKGCRNMQDSYALKLEQVQIASEKDKEKYFWGN